MFLSDSDSDNYFVICGIDPGLIIGISFIFVNVKTFNIEKYISHTVNCHKVKLNNTLMENQTERLAKLTKLKEMLTYEFSIHKPSAVCIESPFYSSRTPSAFGSIKEIIATVRSAIDNYDDAISLLTVDPPSVKKAVNAKGNHDKDHVREKVMEYYKDIENLSTQSLDCLDEHSIDSLAVCKALYDYVFWYKE